MPEKIILDCDPGIDDVFAILLAHAHPDIELLAVTTVAGNQTLPIVTHNALVTGTIAGMTDVPFAAGADRPLVRDQIIAPEYHGSSGLRGADLPAPTINLDPRHAVDLIIETVLREDPGTVTLVPVGPLTNIALAIRKAPEIVTRVKEVVLMGGAYATGNITPAAEFNVLVDPEAASVVFGADWKVTMIGLDLTNQAQTTQEVIRRFEAIGTPSGDFCTSMFPAYAAAYDQLENMPDAPMHDPCAVAYVIDRSLIEVRRAHVDVELRGTHTYGMTVTDFLGRDGAQLRADVGVHLDASRFWDLTIDAIASIRPETRP